MTVFWSVVVFVGFSVGLSSTVALKEFKSDQSCQGKGTGRWSCKLIKECPAAVQLLNNEKIPEICGFKGFDAMTCCEELPGEKSKEMCNKYAESVFIRVQDDLSGGLTNYDTCALNKQNTRLKRVVGGVESTSRQYPHMASIGKKADSTTPTKWLCGGSLISDRYILSSAACALGSTNVVRLGDLNIVSDTDEEMSVAQPSEFEIIDRIVHPQFKKGQLYNDIALMKLNTSVYFTEFIRPICLHTDYTVRKLALVTGWGRTSYAGLSSDTLLTANLTIISIGACNKSFESILTERRPSLPYGISDSQMICAVSTDGEADSCQGDAGGPLQVPLQEPYCMYSQVGITSFGVGCGDNKPSVYTRVSHFVPWIESVVWPPT